MEAHKGMSHIPQQKNRYTWTSRTTTLEQNFTSFFSLSPSLLFACVRTSVQSFFNASRITLIYQDISLLKASNFYSFVRQLLLCNKSSKTQWHKANNDLLYRSGNFFWGKDYTVNILDFVGQKVFAAITQPYIMVLKQPQTIH